MEEKEFIKKWNVAYEDKEQKLEFSKEMGNDLKLHTQQLQTELKEARERIDELIINQNDVLQQLEKNESMADFVIATETVRILLTK